VYRRHDINMHTTTPSQYTKLLLNTLQLIPNTPSTGRCFTKQYTSGTAKAYVFFVLRVIQGHQKIKYVHIYIYISYMTTYVGSIMAQTVSRRLLTAGAWVRFPVSPCGICSGQKGTGTDFNLSTSVLPRHYHSTIAPTLYYLRPSIIHLERPMCTP
jgi:hypothetical protein